MRIALVIANYNAYGGGAERWTDRYARMLIERGHQVDLFARRFNGAPDEAARYTVEVGRHRNQPRLQFGLQAERMLREHPADVVHDMGDGWYADLFMPHHGTRRGTFKHNVRYLNPVHRRARSFANKWVPRYREFRALERRQFDRSLPRLYLAVSRMIREHMKLYCHVPEEDIRVVYNGVDVDRFRPPVDAHQRQRRRTELGLGDETVFLTVAHNFRLKGLDALLKSMGRLRDRPVRLLVVGNGSIAQYQSIARAEGCDQVVRFLGNQSDPVACYQAADVFVLPTYYDPCSLVVLEAMATGLPIITTRFNGVHELMHPGREGLVLDDPADVDALTEALETYLDEPAREAAGTAARSLAKLHSTDRMFTEHLKIYEEIIANRARRPVSAGAAMSLSRPTAPAS